MIYRAHKIRLYPSEEQEQKFRQTCGVARFAYNWGLARWKEQYEAGEKVNQFDLRRELNAIKREQFPWMMEVTKCAPMSALEFLGEAFRNFFKKNAGYPKFKPKGRRESYTVGIEGGNFRFSGKKIFLPKLGWVKTAEPLRWPDAKLNRVTIKLSGSRWYAVVGCELPDQPQNAAISESLGENQAIVVGVDLGLKTFATLSTGEKVEHPKYLTRALPKLRRLQQDLARKQKGSRNRDRAKRKLSLKYASTANQRNQFIHRFTTDLARRFDHLVIEDLDIVEMRQLASISRSVCESGFGMFRLQLEYKAKKLTIADRWFASTKTCSCCGTKNQSLTMADRSWTCPICSSTHDRDINAAINLQHLGQTATSPEAISALAACGDLDGRSAKQEICTK